VPKERRGDRNSVTQGDTKCVLGAVVLGANAQSQSSGHAATPNAIIDDSVITVLDAASPESSFPQMGPLKPDLVPHSLQVTRSVGKGTKMLRRKQIRNIPQSCARSSTPNTKPNLHIEGVANGSWVLNFRPPASNPPTADPHRRNSFQSTLGRNCETEHSPKKMHQAPASILDETASRVSSQRTNPTLSGRFLSTSSENTDEALRNSALGTGGRGGGRCHNGPTVPSMRNPKTR